MLVVAALGSALFAGCASHSSSLSAIDRQFVNAAPTWDLDHDGVVTCDEWRRYASQLFGEADSGHKGYLELADFTSLAAQDRLFQTASFAYYDVNKDGRVTKEEFVDRPNPAFAYLNKRDDCQLTSAELLRAYNPAAGERARTAETTPRTRR